MLLLELSAKPKGTFERISLISQENQIAKSHLELSNYPEHETGKIIKELFFVMPWNWTGR